MPKTKDSTDSTGPIYGVQLIDVLSLGDGSMQQAMPTRKDLKAAAQMSQRTAAGYEVLLTHYRESQAENERLKAILNECWTAAGLLGENWTQKPDQAVDYSIDLVQQILDNAGDAAALNDEEAAHQDTLRLWEESKARVDRLSKANAVLRGRLADIASDSAFQPGLHAAAGIAEADEILSPK
jgi:glucose/arabinose dehydrogenase